VPRLYFRVVRADADFDCATERGKPSCEPVDGYAFHAAAKNLGHDEVLRREGRDRAGCREPQQQLDQPVAVIGADEVLDLRKVQGKVVIAQPVSYPGPGQRDLMMSLRQLLRVVDAADQRIMPNLAQTSLEQVQDDLRILRIVFVPGVVHRLASAG
jgi:hypothetical protein